MKKANKFLVLIICLLFTFSFQVNSSANPEELYFPKDIFDKNGELYRDSWYENILRIAKEPSIFSMNLDENKFVCRFLRVDSLSLITPAIVLIEIDLDKNIGTVVLKLRNVAYYFYEDEPGYFVSMITLEPDQCEEFLLLIKNNGFWAISSAETFPTITLPNEDEYEQVLDFLDGSHWLIEGKSENGYHAVSRISPKSQEAGRDLDNLKIYEIGTYMDNLFKYTNLPEQQYKSLERLRLDENLEINIIKLHEGILDIK